MVKIMENKVALVTGGGSGIGRASSLAFVRQGAKLVVADIDTEGGKETVRMIEENGGQAIFVRDDVSSATDVEALIEKTIHTYGRLDYAHNNAGVLGMTASTTDYTEEDWDRTVNINLKGVWLCMKYEIPQMLKQGGGAIVNTSSIGGLGAIPNSPAYLASKHGVLGLTKAAAVEYAKSGIRVNAICPGPTDTPMIQGKADGKRVITRPMGRAGKAEEVAEAVIWLCSDAASFVNGHGLVIDGGSSVLQPLPMLV
jgi:NAD(P)-dependent dehydrogenase (short-subunit alcohol dehydrogenase family)